MRNRLVGPFASGFVGKSLDPAERPLARSSTISVDVTSKPLNPLNEAISGDKTARSLVSTLYPHLNPSLFRLPSRLTRREEIPSSRVASPLTRIRLDANFLKL